MRYIIFDTETTGLSPSDRVIQIAGFVLDDNLKIVDIFNKFVQPLSPIPSKIVNITKITTEMACKYSDGNPLWVQLESLGDYFVNAKDTVYVGHNINFDKTIVNQTLKMEGYPELNFGPNIPKLPMNLNGKNFCLCTMTGLSAILFNRDRAKLTELCDKSIIKGREGYKEELFNSFKKLVDVYKVEHIEDGLDFHNALYDSYITLLLFLQYKGRFLGAR